MAGPSSSIEEQDSTASPFGPGVPALPEDATPEQKDAHWFKHVYQGDQMPQLTVRAVVVGGVLGMLMAAANLYTTLAIGDGGREPVYDAGDRLGLWRGHHGVRHELCLLEPAADPLGWQGLPDVDP
ncbi:MAG: hypothetical protein NTV94_15950 [Planctomycetota bacterium]|nr:hypothetical protein [Planctomycetota bacterium]